MTNHPNRGGARPHPTADEVRAARESVGHTETEAAATVYSTLSAWQRWEQGGRRMPPGLRELYSFKADAPLYAIYDGDAVHGIGESIAAALQDADMTGKLVPQSTTDTYPQGVVVDLIHARRLTPDGEAAYGQLKLRRCSVGLYQAVMRDGGRIEFDITDRGILDLADDGVYI